jgi:hypothetical protein
MEQASFFGRIDGAAKSRAEYVPSARLCWGAAVVAALAAVLFFAEAASLGLALVWSAVRLLHLPDSLIAGLGTVVIGGCVAAGTWLCRAAYASEIANRAELSGPGLGDNSDSHGKV